MIGRRTENEGRRVELAGRYRRRRDTEARRFDGSEQAAGEIKLWAVEGIPGMRAFVYGIGKAAGMVDWIIELRARQVLQTATAGDWIVKDNGQVTIWDHEEFTQTFQPVLEEVSTHKQKQLPDAPRPRRRSRHGKLRVAGTGPSKVEFKRQTDTSPFSA